MKEDGTCNHKDDCTWTEVLEEVIREYENLGIGHWCTHDTDVLPYDALGNDKQHEIVGQIGASLKKNGINCSMVTTETFHHAVFAGAAGGRALHAHHHHLPGAERGLLPPASACPPGAAPAESSCVGFSC